MRKFLRFLFPVPDRLAINAGTMQLTDTPYSTAPVAGSPYPQSLQLQFQLTGAAAPHLIPLFPGILTFIADPAAPGTTPDPNDVTAANYPNWKTRGVLRVRLVDRKVMKEFLTLTAPVGPIPTTLWYGPIVITQDFLFVTLATGLKKKKVISGNTEVLPTNVNWRKHAIARFLQGKYEPELRIDFNKPAADDDVERFPMPEVVVGSNSTVKLTVTVARTQKPQDADDQVFDTNSGTTTRIDPSHHAHGNIPARHVYRTLRADMLDAALGNPVADAVLAEWPDALRYFPISFTRTWKRIANTSVHLPQLSARIAQAPGGALLAEQRLPAHGVLFLSQQPNTPPPDPPRIEVSLIGDVRWFDGAQPNVWRRKGGNGAVIIPLSSAIPHVVVRRRMRDEILADTARPKPGGMRCTYLSLRRTLRALVDNRITGGRLVKEGGDTTDVTKKLLDDAFGSTLSAIIIKGNPKPRADPATASPKLSKLWDAFFPEAAPAHAVGGSTTPRDPYILGQVAYYLWQVGKEQSLNNTKRNFSDAHVGRGSAGAMVATGLATAFTLDPPPKPPRAAGMSDDQYFDHIVETIISGLEPGSLLQFWVLNSDFNRLKNRMVTSPSDIQQFGHSPVFVKLMPIDPGTGKPGGIVVIDQFGQSDCPIEGTAPHRRITWSSDPADPGTPIEIWCAAAWDE